MKRYTAAHVLSTDFCWDYSELKDYRYQAGRTTKAVYAIGDWYYSAVKEGDKPAEHKNDPYMYDWIKHNSSYADSIGWVIYKSHINGREAGEKEEREKSVKRLEQQIERYMKMKDWNKVKEIAEQLELLNS